MLIDSGRLMICKVPDALPRLVNVWGSLCKLRLDAMLEAGLFIAHTGELFKTLLTFLALKLCYQWKSIWLDVPAGLGADHPFAASKWYDGEDVHKVIIDSIYRHTAQIAHPLPNSCLCHRYRESLGLSPTPKRYDSTSRARQMLCLVDAGLRTLRHSSSSEVFVLMYSDTLSVAPVNMEDVAGMRLGSRPRRDASRYN
jgi:hypothetical protein